MYSYHLVRGAKECDYKTKNASVFLSPDQISIIKQVNPYKKYSKKLHAYPSGQGTLSAGCSFPQEPPSAVHTHRIPHSVWFTYLCLYPSEHWTGSVLLLVGTHFMFSLPGK